MIVRQKTLPWIPGQRTRGMGDTQPLVFPFVDTGIVAAPGSTDFELPCIPRGSYGPPAPGQSYCPAPAVTTQDNWDSKTGDSVAKVCWSGLFPWVGSSTADGGCKPVFDVKAPWGLIITAGLGAFLGYKLLGGGRR